MSSLPMNTHRSEAYSESIPPSPLGASRPLASVAALRSSLGTLAGRVASAAELPTQRELERVSTGIAALDGLSGGLPRGAVSEIVGAASSGRTSVVHSALAEATNRGEVCALIDVTDSFDPESAVASGVELSRVLWVRCNGELPAKKDTAAKFSANDFGGHDYIGRAQERDREQKIPGLLLDEDAEGRTRSWLRSPRKLWNDALSRRLEQALRATDLLLQSGGFGLVILDIGDLPLEVARRVPLTTWYRFRRAVENTPTSLVVVEVEALAQSCAALTVKLTRTEIDKSMVPAPTNGNLLNGISIGAEVVRTRQQRTAWQKKPVQRETAFMSHAISHVRNR